MAAKMPVAKGSFNYKSPELKQAFKNRLDLEGKSASSVINELIEGYVSNKTNFNDNIAVRIAVMKIHLLICRDTLKKDLIEREITRLWELVR